jgi:hypothetical protein
VVDSPFLKQVAGGKTCLSATNHNDGEVLLWGRGNERFDVGLIVSIHGADPGLKVKDANGGIAGISATPFLNVCQLSRSGTASKTKLGANPFTRGRESFATARQKFRD